MKDTDRQFWLSIHNGDVISSDRKGAKRSSHVPNPLANVLGGMTPDMIGFTIEMQPTDNHVTVGGERCRVWIGRCRKGTQCLVLVRSIIAIDEHGRPVEPVHEGVSEP